MHASRTHEIKMCALKKSVFIFVSALCIICSAEDIRQGGWDAHLSMSVQDPATGAYRNMVDERRQECFSQKYIDSRPFQNPEADRTKLERDFGSCSVAKQNSTETAPSWTIECISSDGKKAKHEATNQISAEKVILLSETEKESPSGLVKIKMLSEYQFIGTCTPGMSNR